MRISTVFKNISKQLFSKENLVRNTLITLLFAGILVALVGCFYHQGLLQSAINHIGINTISTNIIAAWSLIAGGTLSAAVGFVGLAIRWMKNAYEYVEPQEGFLYIEENGKPQTVPFSKFFD